MDRRRRRFATAACRASTGPGSGSSPGPEQAEPPGTATRQAWLARRATGPTVRARRDRFISHRPVSCRGHPKHGQHQHLEGWYSKTPIGCEYQPLHGMALPAGLCPVWSRRSPRTPTAPIGTASPEDVAGARNTTTDNMAAALTAPRHNRQDPMWLC